MISTEVNVNIYGALSENLYSAYISGKGIDSQNAYVVTRKGTPENFMGIITAEAFFSDGSQRPVVALKNEIMYEPEIREKLSALRHIEPQKLSCLYEKSCGAVILYKNPDKGEYEVLLVKNNNGRFYSFPKGHVELRESEKQTAVREVKEETNLDVTILDGFREVSDYCPFGKIRKRVVFFLATSKSNRITIQESEIDSYNWVPLREAEKGCTYDNDRRIIAKVRRYVAENKL
ncbi:MAG: NUDIX domain-containing protein [Ruminococcus sp.]|nr:NUDIX domain-containing protein [Ruminococcus sp.]